MSSSLSKIDASEYLVNGTPIDYDDMSGTLTLDKITDVTATADEVNTLDGITATVGELNILDGVTSTAAELNILDGVNSTTTEIDERVLCIGGVANFTSVDFFGIVPWTCTATAFYIVAPGGVGTWSATARNNGGTGMGSVTVSATAGTVASDTSLSSATFTAGQKWEVDITSSATSVNTDANAYLVVSIT